MVIAGAEIVKYLLRFVFGRKSRLVRIVEGLEDNLKYKNTEITELRAENAGLKKANDGLPDAAIARAENEWRYKNYERASHELQSWFDTNAAGIARIATSLARFHISRAVPDPGDHLDKARNLLRLARAAVPGNQEARELESELDTVNAVLQARLFFDGVNQIAWNSDMAPLPAIRAIHAVAQYCFEKGLYRLASIFGDRASDIALSGVPALRNTWFTVERLATFYQVANGQYPEALDRSEILLSESRQDARRAPFRCADDASIAGVRPR